MRAAKLGRGLHGSIPEERLTFLVFQGLVLAWPVASPAFCAVAWLTEDPPELGCLVGSWAGDSAILDAALTVQISQGTKVSGPGAGLEAREAIE